MVIGRDGKAGCDATAAVPASRIMAARKTLVSMFPPCLLVFHGQDTGASIAMLEA
jgi:hypothetical protein